MGSWVDRQVGRAWQGSIVLEAKHSSEAHVVSEYIYQNQRSEIRAFKIDNMLFETTAADVRDRS